MALTLCEIKEAEMQTCPDCNGDGVIDQGTDEEQRCPTCGGLGFVPDNDDDREEALNTLGKFRLTACSPNRFQPASSCMAWLPRLIECAIVRRLR